MVARSRLSRSSRLGGVDSRLRTSIASNLKTLPTARLKKYAELSKGTVSGNPVLALTKAEAQHELMDMQKEMLVWEKGAGALAKKQPLAPRIAKGFGKALELAGKGAREFGKVISGEKAREFEDVIATAGMKPDEKAKYLEQAKAERAAREKEESFELIPAEEPEFMRPKKAEREEEPDLEPYPLTSEKPEEFNLAKEQAELAKEMEISRREAFGIERAPRKRHHKKKRAKTVVRYVPMYQPYAPYQQPMMMVRR